MEAKRTSRIFRTGAFHFAIAIALVIPSGARSAPDSTLTRTVAPFVPSPSMAQFPCVFDCRDISFRCCNSEGGCVACFDFDVVSGRKSSRKEIPTRANPHQIPRGLTAFVQSE